MGSSKYEARVSAWNEVGELKPPNLIAFINSIIETVNANSRSPC
jgi:hypothetical protein